jgi:hypothetical protein
MRRCSLLISLIVLGFAAAPASASTTFGADLAHGEAGVPFNAATFAPGIVFTLGHGGTTDGVLSLLTLKDDGTPAVAPVDGVLTSFSMRMSAPVTGAARLVLDGGGGPDPLAGYGRSATVTVPGDSVTHTFPTRLPVVAGMNIGFVTPKGSNIIVWRTASTKSLRMMNDLAEDGIGMSEGILPSTFTFQTPISGTIEPDADKDGFGDETQDACPGVVGTDGGCVPKPPSTGGGTPTGGGDQTGGGQPIETPPATPTSPTTPAQPAPDVLAPSLGSFLLSPSSFIAANAGPGVVAAKRRAVGTTVVYKLSEAATATFSVTQKVTGVKKGKTCVAGKPGHGKKKCTRTVVLGSFTQSGNSGLNSFKFMGRLKNKALKKGSYALVATATDAAGNKSKTAATRAFKIVS